MFYQELGLVLRDTLCDDCYAGDLRVLQRLHGAVERGAKGREVDECVRLRVSLHGRVQLLVAGQEDLLEPPVELLLVVVSEGIHHGCDGGRVSGAHVVVVQHALHCLRLHAPYDGLCALGEELLSGGVGSREAVLPISACG